KKFKKDCECLYCEQRYECCNNNYNTGTYCLVHSSRRCSECNELFHSYNNMCYWDHNKPFCKFCNLPISRTGFCINYHRESDALCSECGMPEMYGKAHEHDGKKCKICNSLLNYGKCIYFCNGGGSV